MFTSLIKWQLLMSTWYMVCLNAAWCSVDNYTLELEDTGSSLMSTTHITYRFASPGCFPL